MLLSVSVQTLIVRSPELESNITCFSHEEGSTRILLLLLFDLLLVFSESVF